MRIGIDARLWNESGVGRYTRNLVEQLQAIDKENEYVLFALSVDKEQIQSSIHNSQFKVILVDIRWHSIKEQLLFPKIINQEGLDVMHFPYFSVPIFYKKPFIVTVHDLILHHYPTGEASTLPLPIYRAKHLGYKFIIQQAVKKAKKIVTVSQATKEEIVDHLHVSADKVIVTYEGIDEKLVQSIDKTNVKDEGYLLHVGNLYPHKNINRLLAAISKLIKQEIPVKLVLVGREDYFAKKLKEKMVEQQLVKHVLFAGEVSDEALQEAYEKAKAVIIPSVMEGFSLPAVEAMANSCLVLASDIPVHREVCGAAAVYFDPYDIDDIADKIATVYAKEKNSFEETIAEGRKKALAFSWEKMARETLKVYESCSGV